MLIANVVHKHGCENLISVNISILCPYICVCLSFPVILTFYHCVRKWEESQ